MNKTYKIFSLLSMLMLTLWISGCAGSDRDKDGIPDNLDECPSAAEDMDKFEDNDGCPDPDNDKDKVPDTRDKCVFVAEDLDGFEDDDGCPDNDNDGDGIPDSKDKCPNAKEDFDGFEDADGCPEVDNDKDGVPDEQDKCPLDKEDQDGFEDDDGCPDLDNDGDGIQDEFDQCPNEKEVMNGKDDSDGCPDVEADPIPVETTLNLRFETGTPTLTYNDKIMLEQALVKGLVAYPKHKIYVYVYMPKIEMEIEEYLELLNARTQSISTFLIEKGVKAEQIKTRTITPELYEANVETAEDFNQDKPAVFKRK